MYSHRRKGQERSWDRYQPLPQPLFLPIFDKYYNEKDSKQQDQKREENESGKLSNSEIKYLLSP